MANKIIIDGVNVSECSQFIKENNGCLYGGYCENSDCLYKQIQYKEQQLKTAKEAYEVCLVNKENRHKKEVNRYKQALEKIEEIASKNIDSPNLECIYKEGPRTFPKCKDEFTQNGETCIVRGREEILNIINEVKDD